MFYLFFFFPFPFSLLPIFLLQLLAFYQAAFEFKNFRESVNYRQEILAMDKQRVERGNFLLSFLPKF